MNSGDDCFISSCLHFITLDNEISNQVSFIAKKDCDTLWFLKMLH